MSLTTTIVCFDAFNDMAQFTADLFNTTEDQNIEPINEFQVRIPSHYAQEFRHLIDQFGGRENMTDVQGIAETRETRLTHEQRATLNRQNAQRILEETRATLRTLG